MEFTSYDIINYAKKTSVNEEEYVDALLDILSINEAELKDFASRELNRMNRCQNCGAKLEVMTYREYHPEVDAFEPMSDVYCPECDIG